MESVKFNKIDGLTFPGRMTDKTLNAAKNFTFSDDDILSVSYPKMGQTWLLTILHLIKHSDMVDRDEEPNYDLRDMNFLEFVHGDGESGLEKAIKRDPPRIIKSHLPLRYFQEQLDRTPKVKVILMVRNPKDTLVSLYHFYRMNKAFGPFTGSWNEFFDMFKRDALVYGDLFQDTKEWYMYNRDRHNSLILFYEDMKKDLKGNVKKITSFLGKELSEVVVNKIVHTVTFDNMSKNPKYNHQNVPAFDPTKSKFMRKGMVGNWVEYFSTKQNEFIDDKIKEHYDPICLNVQEVPDL